MPEMNVSLAGLELRSPVVLAAGTAGYLDELEGLVDLSPRGGVGALCTKSITRLPREGNETWRVLPAGAGMLNAIGLANVGADRFIEHTAPKIAPFQHRTGVRVIGSVAGIPGWEPLGGRLAQTGGSDAALEFDAPVARPMS